MSDHDDADGVIHRLVPDDQAERLLAGRAGGGDGDLAPVAALFAALREPGRPDELIGSDELLTHVMVAARTDDGATYLTHRRPRPVARLVSGKVAVVVAVVALSGGAAAASTGQLPDPVQRTVAAAFSRVGIDLPSPTAPPPGPPADRTPPDTTVAPTGPTSSNVPPGAGGTTSGPAGTSRPTTATATAPTTPTATGGPTSVDTGAPPDPTWVGPCQAHEAAGGTGSASSDDLSAAAAAAGLSVEAFCAERTEPPRPDPSSEDRGASGSTPAATAPGQVGRPDPDGATPGTTGAGSPGRPGRDGSTPAATAPGAPGAKPGGGPPSTPGSAAPTAPERRGP